MTLGIPKYLNRNLRAYISETPQKAYTLLGLSLITIIIFGTFGIYPAIASVFKIKANIEQGKKYETTFDQKITALKAASVRLRNEAAAVTKISELLPISADNGQFIQDLSLLASNSLVKLDFIQKVSITEAASSGENKYWIGLSGSYGNIEKFLKDLGSFKRLVSIASIGLSSLNSQARATVYLSTFNYVR
ncbi:MAG: type 4a pilus biogenesis protein PilO [candidate division WWE3 bacterium]|nr:type 4a pilus biogenesis protein PilO [candidate division WWE3 bacterium]